MRINKSYLAILMATLALFNARSGQAKEITEAQDWGATLAINTVSIQGPSLDLLSRTDVELAGYYPLYKYITGVVALHIMPDDRKRSGRIDIREDYYWLNPRIKASYSKLLRFSISAGPTIVYSRSETKFDATSRSSSTYQLGGNLLFLVEYAFEEWLELSFRYGWHQRFEDDKRDGIYGFGFNVNISAI